jgi:hypothetical protein
LRKKRDLTLKKYMKERVIFTTEISDSEIATITKLGL